MVEACVENSASCIDVSGEPRVCDSRKRLLCIEDLLKERLFSVFHVSADVFEHKDKRCLLSYSFKLH